ncbi:unnamed protein product [Sphagnum balticum]
MGMLVVPFFFYVLAIAFLGVFCSRGLESVQAGEAGFDVRQHLSSSTRYEWGKSLMAGYEDPGNVPVGCTPIHINLVARHGTRGPTKKRIKELEKLAKRLHEVAAQAGNTAPAWMRDWKSPWEGKKVGGELLPIGEEEMYYLAQRYRNNYTEIFEDDYHPETYPIITTQVGRSSASAVAFGIGSFAGRGTLGPGKQRAFAVVSDSKGNDIHLRFHDTCMAYKQSKKYRMPAVEKLQAEVYELVAKAVKERLGLALTAEDVSSLWLLCKNEASLLDIVDRACGLFTPEEIELLEWADDLQMHHLKGYGETLNYRMGVPLLEDVVQSMDRAMATLKDSNSDTATEKARLRFAHAETVIPFICLLGLFLDDVDVKSIQSEEPFQAPLRPPTHRLWRGAMVAPFGANTALVLHKCSLDNGTGEEFLVQALHNEKSVSMPGCNGTHFCPIEMFKKNVVAPHLKRSFESLCTVTVEHQPPERQSWFHRLFLPFYLFRWPGKPAHAQSICQSELEL